MNWAVSAGGIGRAYLPVHDKLVPDLQDALQLLTAPLHHFVRCAGEGRQDETTCAPQCLQAPGRPQPRSARQADRAAARPTRPPAASPVANLSWHVPVLLTPWTQADAAAG